MKKAFFYLCMFVLPLLVTLGGLETYLRLTGWKTSVRYQMFDPVVRRAHLRNVTGEIIDPHIPPEFVNTSFRTNSFGLIDRDYSKEKPEGAYRIAFLGDSMIAGVEVAVEKHLDNLLEDFLNKRRKVEILNFGRRGIGVAEQYFIWHREVKEFKPDLLTMFIYPVNDFNDLYTFYREGFPDPLAEEIHVRFKHRLGYVRSRFQLWLETVTKWYPFIREKYVLWQQTVGTSISLESVFAAATHHDTLVGEHDGLWQEKYYSIMDKLVRDVRAAGVGINVVLLGYSKDYRLGNKPGNSAAFQKMIRFFAERNVPAINLADEFNALPNPRAMFFHQDIHLNEAGHLAVAQLLLPFYENLLRSDSVGK